MPPLSRVRLRPAFPRHLVTAVLVSHDGERWLRRCLAALEAQTRPAQRAVAVDTGSHDASLHILAAGLGASRIVHADRTTGFGAAIALGLEAYSGAPMPPNGPRAEDGEPVEWVWILHDDCAPEPHCLEALLARAEESPSVAVLGAKARGWDQSRLLLEVGLTTDGAGHRHTDLDRREVDQGQHDSVRDVLAVGSAGMLVRRDVWDELGGFDPRLPLFRDDLDFGWRANLAGHRVEVVTDAVVHHAQAAAAGHRRLAATKDFPRRIDRRNALFSVLANASPLGFVVGVPRLTVASLLRALLFLLTRRPLLAIDELAAYLRLVRSAPSLLSARRARRTSVRVPRRSLRPLMAKPSARARAISEHMGDWLTAGRSSRGLYVTPVSHALETGPSVEDDELPTSGINWRNVLLAPGLLVFLGLTVVALVAERHLLGRHGILSGGRLLPPPAGASDLWHTYVSAFHPVGTGSTSDAAPYLPVLALLSGILLGKVWLAVDVLLLGCVPLAGLTAYLATRHHLHSRAVRAYAAVTYALLPVGIGCVTSGRLGVAVAFVLMPMLVRALARCFIAATRPGGWRFAWSAGLLLAVAAAFAPDVLPTTVLAVLVVAVLAAVRRPAHAARFVLAGLIVVVVPVLLLVPYTNRVWSQPGLLVLGTGRVAPLVDLPHARPSDLAFAWPGGLGVPAWWLATGLLVAALTVLLRRDRVLTGLSAWALVGAGLICGVIASHTTASTDGVRALGWPGAAAAAIGVGLVMAAALAADGALPRLAASSFGLRQPLALSVAVLALTAPLLAMVSWLSTGPPDDAALHRHGSTVLPDFLAGNLGGSTGMRALVLRPFGNAVSYSLVDGSTGRTLDEAELAVPPAQRQRLDQLVQAVSGGSGDAVAQLATYSVGYIAAVSPSHALSQALATTVGLISKPSQTSTQVWRVSAAVGRLTLRPAAGDLTPPTLVPSTDEGSKATLVPGAEGRTLVLADAANSGWRATLDGHPLTSTVVDGWAQGFVVPGSGGRLALAFDSSHRDSWLAAQLVILMLVLVLAAPSVRADDALGEWLSEDPTDADLAAAPVRRRRAKSTDDEDAAETEDTDAEDTDGESVDTTPEAAAVEDAFESAVAEDAAVEDAAIEGAAVEGSPVETAAVDGAAAPAAGAEVNSDAAGSLADRGSVVDAVSLTGLDAGDALPVDEVDPGTPAGETTATVPPRRRRRASASPATTTRKRAARTDLTEGVVAAEDETPPAGASPGAEADATATGTPASDDAPAPVPATVRQRAPRKRTPARPKPATESRPLDKATEQEPAVEAADHSDADNKAADHNADHNSAEPKAAEPTAAEPVEEGS